MQLVYGILTYVRTQRTGKSLEEGFKDSLRGVQSSGYNERPAVIGLTTLKERKDRGDHLQAYKLINGLEIINELDF